MLKDNVWLSSLMNCLVIMCALTTDDNNTLSVHKRLPTARVQNKKMSKRLSHLEEPSELIREEYVLIDKWDDI